MLPALARAIFEDGSNDVAGMADVVIWTEAIAASVQGHQRDVDGLLPWVHLTAGAASSGELTLGDLPDHCQTMIETLAEQRAERTLTGTDDDVAKIDRLIAASEQSAAAAKALIRQIENLDERAGKLFDEMQFGFLFDPARQLLSIGYQFAEDSLDPSCYDLLASEARLASFIAIAKATYRKTLVQIGARRDPDRPWFRSNLMVGIDVRVSDAGTGDARARREPVASNGPVNRESSDRVRLSAWSSVGSLQVRVQLPQSRTQLSIFQFWCPRTWAKEG